MQTGYDHGPARFNGLLGISSRQPKIWLVYDFEEAGSVLDAPLQDRKKVSCSVLGFTGP